MRIPHFFLNCRQLKNSRAKTEDGEKQANMSLTPFIMPNLLLSSPIL
jgi:hypothetical protein